MLHLTEFRDILREIVGHFILVVLVEYWQCHFKLTFSGRHWEFAELWYNMVRFILYRTLLVILNIIISELVNLTFELVKDIILRSEWQQIWPI